MLVAGAVEKPVVRIEGDVASECEDVLAIEEPLEIQIGWTRPPASHRSVSITMRTPGEDFALAAGFLFTEGILTTPTQVESIAHWGPLVGEEKVRNIVRVSLRPDVAVDWRGLDRHFYTTSSCGVCGKSSIAALRAAGCAPLPPDRMHLNPALLHGLPALLRAAQNVFAHTGGLHAAALFSADAGLLALQEDVGRHNAVDKLIGTRFLSAELPAADCILLVSGRASFELVQKAAVAGIPVLAAVGAPSSLAVELAASLGMTLAGFVRDGRFNLYTHAERVRLTVPCDKKE
ncbi:MAG: formate dehydrogenase accessory sulfurtransferase FdhD [Bryobacteraceae bacterium]